MTPASRASGLRRSSTALPLGTRGSNQVSPVFEEASVPPPCPAAVADALRLLARWLVAAARGAATEAGSSPPASAQNPLDVITGTDVMSNPE